MCARERMRNMDCCCHCTLLQRQSSNRMLMCLQFCTQSLAYVCDTPCARANIAYFSFWFGSVFATIQAHATIKCLLMSFLSLWFFTLVELVWSLHSTHSIAKSVTAIICFDMVALLRRHWRWWRQRQ